MKLIKIILLLAPIFCIGYEMPPCKILEENIPKGDKRYQTFEYALQLLKERNCKVLVETGTSRCGKRNFVGDGGSTYIFGEWAYDNKAILYSVDVDPEALFRAEEDLDSKIQPYVYFVASDSVAFLKNFEESIDFLYLDSYDFSFDDPNPSQQHHLNEIVAAYPKLKDTSIVMIDDCGLPYGGKGKLVIDYLLKRGWKIVMQGYQVILIKT